MVGFKKALINDYYSEAYLTGGSVITISTANVVHAWLDAATVQGETKGSLGFNAGSTGTITATADNTILRCTDVAHGLSTGDIVTLVDMADAAHNGVTTITKIDDDTFDCDDITYNGADAGGLWRQGDYFEILPGGSGIYQALMTGSITKGVGSSSLSEVGLYVNTTLEHKIQRQLTSTDTGAFPLSGLIDLNVGDRIWIGITNVTTTNTLKIGEASFHLHAV